MLNLVLFGPPGAGKGTQSEKIIASYGLTHLSTGDLFRKHLGEGTALGVLAKGYMDQGHLVPDEVVIQMVEDKIASAKDSQGFIFDGFPRTTAQAEALDAMLLKNDMRISGMIALEVPQAILKERILERGKTSGRPDDQDEEKIRNRYQEYNEKTAPLMDFYNNQNKFYPVDGIGSIAEITQRLSAVIESL